MIFKIQLVGLVSMVDVQELRFTGHVIAVGNRARYLGKISRYKTWKRMLDRENENEQKL